MATVRIAARVKNGWALGGSLLARRQASKRLWEDPQRGCGEARQDYRLPTKEAPAFVPTNFTVGVFLGRRCRLPEDQSGTNGVRVMRALEAGTLVSDWSGGSEGKGGRRMTEGRGERARRTPDITIHDPDDVIGGVAGGGSGERATGTPNTIYDLSSVLFHALEGGASYDTYIEDAEREGDQELADFFIQVRDEDSMRADEARRLLAERSPTTTTSATGGDTSVGATGGMGTSASG